MNILFEELAAPQRAGGVEAATRGLCAALESLGARVARPAIGKAMPAGKPDCVHVHGIWSPALYRRCRHWEGLGVPCVVTLHGTLEPWAFAHKRWKKRLAWLVYQKAWLNRASALHATSEREANNLRALGLKPEVVMIPWGIELPGKTQDGKTQDARGVRGDASGQESEGTSNIQHSKSKITSTTLPFRTALFVGRIYPVKGLPMLVEAWSRVRPPGWKMKIVGPDEAGHLTEVQALVHDAGLGGVFEFTGPLDGEALEDAYRNADLFILPSHTENFGMVVAEALAHGVPVIASQGTPWQILEDRGCGWWPEISSDSLANALRAATDLPPDDLGVMGVRGRTLVEERFTWPQVAARMLEVYKRVGRGGQERESEEKGY